MGTVQVKTYAVKAGGEAEFQRFPSQIDELLSRLRDRAKSVFVDAVTSFEKMSTEVRTLKIDRYAMIGCGKNGLAQLDSKLGEAQNAAATNTYFGYIEASTLLEPRTQRRTKCLDSFKLAVSGNIRERIDALRKSISNAAEIKRKERVAPVAVWSFCVVFVILELILLPNSWRGGVRQGFGGGL